ncbi:MAG: hypothetical protein ACRDOK_28680 [Streptosporangiaceae bacterium]
MLLDLHPVIVAHLAAPTGRRPHPVAIPVKTDSAPAGLRDVAGHLDLLIDTVNGLEEPPEKALAYLVLLPYVQKAGDCSISTRMMSNIRWAAVACFFQLADASRSKGRESPTSLASVTALTVL